MTNREKETMVTIAGLRRICGAQPGEIEALIRSRVLVERNGQIGLVAGIRAFLDNIRAATKSASLAAAQDASRAARADAAELALAVDARSMIPVDDAHDALARLAGEVMSSMGVIPARVTRDVRDRRQVETAIRDIQNEIAQAVQAGGIEPARPAKRKAKP